MTQDRNPSRLAAILRASALLAAGAALAALLTLNPLGLPLPWERGADEPRTPSPDRGAHAGAQLWTCGMHPQVVQDHPGTCPICHMQLVPMRAPQAGSESEVHLDPGFVQRMNVTLVPVARRDLVRTVRTVGTVAFDHALESTVTVKFAGYVERVHVHLVGETVRRGQPLFDVYSPELVRTQQDLVAALQFARRLEAGAEASEATRARAEGLVTAARERLRLWDISKAQVERVEATGEVSRLLTVTAPATGVITAQPESLVGTEVRPGMGLHRIADTSHAWITAEIYEDQVAAVEGQDHAWVTLEALPGMRLAARVLAIKPWVQPETRTMHLTLGLPNADGRLRQGMYANVEFTPVIVRDALVVPSQAVLRTGRRNVAVVAKDGGRFSPREVALGAESDGEVQVLSGLAAGESVVTSAQFLIDSESSLQAAVHAMHAAPPR